MYVGKICQKAPLKVDSNLESCMLFCSEFDEMLRIRREVDKRIGEITTTVQVHTL